MTSIDLEGFARLCRLLDAPFADRARVLAEHALTEHDWTRVRTAWLERLRVELGDLAPRFRAAYRGEVTVRQELESEVAASEDATEPGRLAPSAPLETPSLATAAQAAFPPPIPTGFETDELSPWGFTPSPPLPFRQSDAPSPMAQPSGAPGARPSNTDVMDEYVEEEPNMRTGMMPAVGFPVPAATPWTGPMSVEDYASLCAEAAVFPHRLMAIYANRRIRTPEQARLLHGEFMARFRANPTLHQRWTELVAATTAILRRTAGGGA